MDEAISIWRQLELPQLRLHVPWYGYELGWWSEAEREAGRFAIAGRYAETGEKLKKARVRTDDNE
jgi:hypothetical protein